MTLIERYDDSGFTVIFRVRQGAYWDAFNRTSHESRNMHPHQRYYQLKKFEDEVTKDLRTLKDFDSHAMVEAEALLAELTK